jgi:hypothetical protein
MIFLPIFILEFLGKLENSNKTVTKYMAPVGKTGDGERGAYCVKCVFQISGLGKS